MLHERRKELARRRGSVVLVGGSAGIGKTRLLGEFCRAIGGGRAPLLLRTECFEYGNVPFEPVREIFFGLPGAEGANLDAAARDTHERGSFFHSLERIVRSAAEKRSIVICIEDVHWADPATLEFLAYLAPRIATDRILIVLTYRDDEVDAGTSIGASLARIARAPAAYSLALKPLGDGEMLQLVDSAFGSNERPSTRSLHRVIARAEGNPFYAEELLKAIDGGDAVDDLPRSIEALVLERFETLAEDERSILLHAAILGYRFDPDLLRSILVTDASALTRTLKRASERNLIVEEAEQHLRFRFRHALTHEAILKRMLAFEARPLHVRVALLLESLPDSERRLGDIAYHWWKAMDPERTVTSNEAAADAAMGLYAYRDAGTFYERALAFSTDRDTQSRLYGSAALCASVQGDQTSAIAYYERALNLELEAGRFASAAELVRRVAGRLVFAGREAEARARLDTFMRDQRANLTAVDALLVEGWPTLIDVGGGGVRAWRKRFMESDALQATSEKDLWGLLLLEVNAHAAVGDIARWRATFERLRHFAREGGISERMFAYLALALTAAYDGSDAPLARASVEDALQFCERHGLDSFVKFVATCDAFDRYLHGDLQGARSAAHRALTDRDDANQRANMAVIGPMIGLDLDDPDLIGIASDAALLGALEREYRPNGIALAAGGVASRLLSIGRYDEAARMLERAVDVLETLFGAQFLLPLAARHVETTRAREKIDELLRTVERDDRSGLATAAMARAIFASRDRSEDRIERARAAAERYAEIGWLPLHAQALELAGDLVGAREIFMRCGNVRQVRRLTRGAESQAQPVESGRALGTLSAREREVALDVAAGFGNAEIAGRLGLSVKTIESHLSRVYARLGLRSRAQLASLVARDDREQV